MSKTKKQEIQASNHRKRSSVSPIKDNTVVWKDLGNLQMLVKMYVHVVKRKKIDEGMNSMFPFVWSNKYTNKYIYYTYRSLERYTVNPPCPKL